MNIKKKNFISTSQKENNHFAKISNRVKTPNSPKTEEKFVEMSMADFEKSIGEVPIITEEELAKRQSIITGIIGLPNAGKSSLLNLILQEKLMAVCSKVQTTRNDVRGIRMLDSTQLVFIDNPGVIDPKNVMDHFMTNSTKRAIKDSEVLLILMDIRTENNHNFDLIIENINKYAQKEKILVTNKIDLFTGDELEQRKKEIEEKFAPIFQKFFYISATEDKGVNELLNYLKSRATINSWLYDPEEISNSSMKFCAAEMTREKLFNNLYSELPYSIIVETDTWKEEDDKITITQTIYVNKDNHKSMIIGAGASMVKKIGTESRIELEQILGKQINLLLHVKTKENWTKNEVFINNTIGYNGS